MNLRQKREILADAAKYDVSCASIRTEDLVPLRAVLLFVALQSRSPRALDAATLESRLRPEPAQLQLGFG